MATTPRKTTKKAPSFGRVVTANEAHELAVKKLATSGLEPSDLTLLRMQALSPEETSSLHESFKGLCALKIPYFDPTDLSKPLATMPKWPAFYRLRYLREGGDQKDDIRYTNEPMAGLAAYFPPSIDWPSIINDPDVTLIVTEGELKAAKACKEGYPTIGLGGVWNFRSSSLGVTFLRELDAINWVKRRVYIMFDSDVTEKSGVQLALNALAEELMLRGALPFIVMVPEGHDGKKQGLDDWCVNNPHNTLLELCQRHQPLTQVRKLFDFNEKLIYVMDNGIVINRKNNMKMDSGKFKEAYQNVDYSELTITDTGSVSLKKAPVATSWLKWPMRSQADSMTYRPGVEQLFTNDGHIHYNLWAGWATNPMKGDVTPFLKLLDHLFVGSDPGDLIWFTRWLAYPLIHPGVKMFSAAVVHGVKHGTGKSLIGYSMARIYGQNFTEISQRDLHGDFNAWAEAKQFVMGDDVTGSNKRQDNDLLKKFITQMELRVNKKFMPEYVVPDCINYYFTSNQPDSFFLEDNDRRFFIHEVIGTPLDEQFYLDYMVWLKNGGAEAIFDYLLNYDLGNFNPAAPALRTAAKDQMTADTRSDLGEWVNKLANDPDSVLRVGDIEIAGDLFTTKDLLAYYDPNESKKTTANGLGREMRRAAVPRANKGLPIRGPKGTDRYYIIRNAEKWLSATTAEISAELHKPVVVGKGKKY